MVTASWRTSVLNLSRPCNRYQCQWQQRHLSSSSSVAGSSVTSAGSSGNRTVTCSSCIYEDEQLGLRTEDLPLPVWKAMQQLRAAGHTVLLVGGAVRDLLLGSPPKDYDLLTSAHLAEVKRLMHKPRVFGRTVPICQLDVDGVRMEISSIHTRPPVRLSTPAGSAGELASAGVPPDAAQILQAGPQAAVAAAAAAAAAAGGQIGRHRRATAAFLPRPQQQQQQQQQRPRQLSWAAARRANALGRDFTVNCLLYDPFAGLLFDYAEGVADIQGRVLRCNGDAAERFSRDPACMLRAVRCAARAGLDVEEQTLAALQQHSHLIINLNSHRLTAELLSMLGYGAASPSLQLLEQTHLLQHLLPLHAAYIYHQQQQSRRPLQQTACTIISTQCSTSSSSSSSPACEEDALQWRQLQHISSEPQAYSALGQLWSCVNGIKPSSGQQQQQQEQALHDQHRRLQHANLLLRVLAGLDQHASVSQPAQAEVVLTCLTAPLLVEALTAAAVQLQRHVQQQARQQEAARQHDQYQQQQLQAEQQQHGALHVLGAASGFKHAAADTYTLVMRSLPAARRIARPFSSSSNCSSSTAAADSSVPSSCASGLESDSLVQQLLQGVAPEECMQQHIIRLAAKVCRQPLPDQALQHEQHSYQGDHSSQLFGAHAPSQVADLIMACIQPSKQQASMASQPKQQQQRRCTRGSMRRSTSSTSSSSNKQQCSPQLDLWDEYAAALPRSNKQFRQLMQRQWDKQLQGAPNGYVGTLATDAGLLAAAEAGHSSSSSRKRLNIWAGSSDGERSGLRDDRAAENLVQQVLQAAGVDLRGLQEQLQQLQSQCLQLQQ